MEYQTPQTFTYRRAVRVLAVIGGPWNAMGPCSSRRQDESDPASCKRSGQSGVDCGYQVVVPLGVASHADRPRADGQAAAAHPPWDARHPPWHARHRLHAVRRTGGRADEGARESDRRYPGPRVRSSGLSRGWLGYPLLAAWALRRGRPARGRPVNELVRATVDAQHGLDRIGSLLRSHRVRAEPPDSRSHLESRLQRGNR
jgi:hypothetical protein